ncbi:hypothetical protein [Nostoc punctiforme]|nr:hypothetical protein [Nostoc punctiforme]
MPILLVQQLGLGLRCTGRTRLGLCPARQFSGVGRLGEKRSH